MENPFMQNTQHLTQKKKGGDDVEVQRIISDQEITKD